MIAYKFEGTRYDCGDKLGFLIANFELEKRNEVMGKAFLKHVNSSLSKLQEKTID